MANSLNMILKGTKIGKTSLVSVGLEGKFNGQLEMNGEY
jgi:hypothetical protein